MEIKNIEQLETSVNVAVMVDGQDWTKCKDKALNQLAKNITVQGFRKGKVPAAVAKKNINAMDVIVKASKLAIPGAFDFLEASSKIKKLDVDVMEQPSVDFKDVQEDSITVLFIYDLYPKTTIKEYKNVKLKSEAIKVSKDEIDAELEKFLKRDTMMVPKKTGAIAKGDVAIFDFVGYRDGKTFEGGKAEGYELEIGSNQFIPGFEEKMIGLKKGEEADLDLTFPKEYQAKELAGKKVVFHVTIQDIKEVKKPKIDAAFIKSLKLDNVKDEKELREYFKKQLHDMKLQKQKEELWGQIINELVKRVKLSHLPMSMLGSEIERIRADNKRQIEQMGIKYDDYVKMLGGDTSKMDEEIKTQAEKNIKTILLMEKIAEQEKITVDKKEYKAHYEKLSKVYNVPVEEIKEKISDEQIEEILINEKTLEKLVEWNKNNK